MNSETNFVPYLGARNYVQGATLFNLVASRLVNASAIDFRLNRRVNNNGLRLVNAVSAKEQQQYPCFVTYAVDGTAKALGVLETEERDPDLRQPYDESPLVDSADFQLGEPSVAAAAREDLSLVDAAVSLNKALLLRVQPLPTGKQYVFTRVELHAWTPSYESLRVSYWRSVGGLHFISRLIVDGRPSGNLYFSLW